MHLSEHFQLDENRQICKGAELRNFSGVNWIKQSLQRWQSLLKAAGPWKLTGRRDTKSHGENKKSSDETTRLLSFYLCGQQVPSQNQDQGLYSKTSSILTGGSSEIKVRLLEDKLNDVFAIARGINWIKFTKTTVKLYWSPHTNVAAFQELVAIHIPVFPWTRGKWREIERRRCFPEPYRTWTAITIHLQLFICWESNLVSAKAEINQFRMH